MKSKLNYKDIFSKSSIYDRLDFSENLSAFLSASEVPCSNFLSAFKTKIVLLHTGRCGSTLLHSALKPFICPPFEIFNPFANELIIKELSASPPIPINRYIDAYLKVVNPDQDVITGDMVLSISATPWVLGGVERISPGFCAALFSGATVVVLRRIDVLRQAISYVLAEKNDFWHAVDENAAAPSDSIVGLSRVKIFEYLDLILWGERRIFYSDCRKLLELSERYELIDYEALSNSPERICSRLLKLIGMKVPVKEVRKSANLPRKIYSESSTMPEVQALIESIPFQLPSQFTVTSDFLSTRERWVL